jgi:hypothetical protein
LAGYPAKSIYGAFLIFSSRIINEKWCPNYFFFYAFRSNFLVLGIVKKIRDAEKKFIPDPGGKKAPDPDLQHWT